MSLNLLQEINISSFLRTLPADIQSNITACLDKWLIGETAAGYPHPAQVCSNLQAANERSPFLDIQQTVNLQVLKSHLQAAI